VQVDLDLFVFRSWDGNQVNSSSPVFVHGPETVIGPDLWRLEADGAVLLETTFSNWENFTQAYPGATPGGEYPA